MTQKKSVGFSLIELTIVVAVVSILAAIAIPFYSANVMKSQVNRSVGEISAYKTAFEIQVTRGATVNNSDLGYAPSSLTTGTDEVNIATSNTDGSGHIQVTIGGEAHPNLAGIIVRLVRNSSGTWACEIDKSVAIGWQPDFRPSGCTVL